MKCFSIALTCSPNTQDAIDRILFEGSFRKRIGLSLEHQSQLHRKSDVVWKMIRNCLENRSKFLENDSKSFLR